MQEETTELRLWPKPKLTEVYDTGGSSFLALSSGACLICVELACILKLDGFSPSWDFLWRTSACTYRT